MPVCEFPTSKDVTAIQSKRGLYAFNWDSGRIGNTEVITHRPAVQRRRVPLVGPAETLTDNPDKDLPLIQKRISKMYEAS
jgi:hypothetical protein